MSGLEVKFFGTDLTTAVPTYGVRADFDPDANEAAVYFDPADMPTEDEDVARARVTFRAERYTLRRGDVDAEFVPGAAVGSFMPVAHGLATAPTVVEATWVEAADHRRSAAQTEVRADGAERVWVKVTNAITLAGARVHLRARVG